MKANKSINTPGAKATAIDHVKTDLVEHINHILKFALAIRALRDVCTILFAERGTVIHDR